MSEAVALADMDRAIAGAEAIIAGIQAGQWAAPTPCTGLDVRTLVNHLVTGNLLFAALVSETARRRQAALGYLPQRLDGCGWIGAGA